MASDHYIHLAKYNDGVSYYVTTHAKRAGKGVCYTADELATVLHMYARAIVVIGTKTRPGIKAGEAFRTVIGGKLK